MYYLRSSVAKNTNVIVPQLLKKCKKENTNEHSINTYYLRSSVAKNHTNVPMVEKKENTNKHSTNTYYLRSSVAKNVLTVEKKN